MVPKVCSFNILIKQVSCGYNHSALLTDQGHLYVMGCNDFGKLGLSNDLPA
jgi:X-linked retinitis pigmentosa GTPase regulator